jgi:2-polyprenyl-3-methyl-5-hydroxy-6-metoxy-1,4-benzoquinol methylase
MQIFEEIKNCRICDSKEITIFMDLTDQPPANSLRSELSENLQNVPLQLMHCSKCSTVQLSATVDPKYLFSHYVWVTGTSKTAHEYSKFFSTNVLERSKVEKPLVVEIASNDGTFLKDFATKGCQILGVDPAKNIAEMATQAGVPTMAEFFNLNTAQIIKGKYGNADIVFARNVIPHVKEVHSIIEGIANLLKEDGLGVIEFHYSQIILDELHYDSVYHEHLFFYSLQSMIFLLKQYGLKPFDLTQSPISGGSLVIYFSKNQRDLSPQLTDALTQEKEKKTNDLQTWQNFSAACEKHAKELYSIVKEYKSKGPVIGYGASARSSTMLNYARLNSEVIDCIVDKNPLKHGRYTPGTNIPIISFEEGKKHFNKCGSILLLAWNFEKEITEELRANGYTGSIIVPLPNAIRII